VLQPYRVLDLDNWDRKDHFHFFRRYDNPFFGLTANVDVSRLLEYTRSRGLSFFAASLFLSQQQVNRIPEFRYRILEDRVIEYDSVSAGSTILKSNQVFTFCYFEHQEDFSGFQAQVQARIRTCKASDFPLDGGDRELARIHYSVIPWVHFSALTHPRSYGTDDSIPKIVFGKYIQQGEATLMPVSVEVHHSLMDAVHVGRYFEGLQSCANFPEKFLEGED